MSSSKRFREKGQSLVEMALSFTLLLVLIGGIVDVGMMFYTYLSLRDTTQEGAVYGSMDPTNTAEITNRVQKSAKYPLDANSITDITITCSGAACSTTSTNSCQGQPITVQVKYSYQFLMPILSTILNSQSWTMSTTVTNTILQTGYDHPDACP